MQRRTTALLILFYALGVLALSSKVFLASRLPSFEGLVPYGGSEEAMYMLRTQEARLHPFTNVTNGVWTGTDAPFGLQSSGLEEAIGALFFWSTIPTPWLIFFLTIFITPLIIPLTFLLLRRTGLRADVSALVAFGFFCLLSYGNRFFHPGFSLPIVLGSLVLLCRFQERPTPLRAMLAGAMLGFSVGVYLWAWTFLWPTAVILCVMMFAKASQTDRRKIALRSCLLFLTAILVALPTFLRLFVARMNPFFEAASIRAGFANSYLPESWMRSSIAVLLALLTVQLVRRDKKIAPILFPMILALAIDYTQQFFHGHVMSFSSHYIHYFTLTCLLLAVTVIVRKQWNLHGILIFGLSGLMLLSAIPDYAGRLMIFVPPSDLIMSRQSLRGALDALNTDTTKETVLTDRKAADLVASYTKHDTVFTEYAAFLLISDDEFIERACLTEAYAKEPIDFKNHVVYAEEWLKVLRKQETEEQYEKSLAYAVKKCEAIRKNPVPLFKKYSVSLLLWDKKNHPDWRIDKRVFRLRTEGKDWSLYEFVP